MKRAIALLCALPLIAGGCARSEASRDLNIFAAASLTASFQAIATAFESSHHIRVRFNFGSSDGLAQQIQARAPADVFASASGEWMDAVARTVGAELRAVFARNRLAIVVPRDNPAHVTSIRDLGKRGLKLVLANASVPAGKYARQALAKAGVAAERNVVSNEDNVKGVVQKVALGEADAGISYVTDVTATVRAISVPEEFNVIASYPIAVVASSTRRDDAAAFVAFVLGEGQAILRRSGFGPAA